MTRSFAGLWPAIATPFHENGDINYPRLIEHGEALFEEGVTGLTVLGTTSEANSLTLAERLETMDRLVEGDIPPQRLIPGTGACAIDDAVALTRRAGELGMAGVLLLPPFYYKDVAEDGLFEFVARVIERAGPRVPPILLYHIPPVAIVGWSHNLIARLLIAFPGIVRGMKDSSGKIEHTTEMLDRFPSFEVLPGSESYLLAAFGKGAHGCISASANVNAKAIVELIRNPDDPNAAELQASLNKVRQAVQARGLIPSIKAVLAARYRDNNWLNVRPPLMKISAAAATALRVDIAEIGLI